MEIKYLSPGKRRKTYCTGLKMIKKGPSENPSCFGLEVAMRSCSCEDLNKNFKGSNEKIMVGLNRGSVKIHPGLALRLRREARVV